MTQRRIRFTAAQPDHRRLGSVPGRRLALAGALCTGLLAFGAGAASADDSSPLVTATIYGSQSQTTNASVSTQALLDNPQQCPIYSGGSLDEHGRQGVVTVTPSPTRSWTLSTILGCLQPAPVSLAQVQSITVIGDQGNPLENPGSQISAGDLGSSLDPIVQSLGSTDQYDRPWRGGSDLDYLDETQTTPIAIEIFEGAPLEVTASASRTTVPVGGTIDFTAAVTGDSGSLSYDWSFGGGASDTTVASPQVQFNSAGVWTVEVQVISAGGGAGGDQLTVTVNQPGSTTTPAKTGPTTTGPDKSSGPTPGGPATTQKKSGTQHHGNQHGHGKNTQTTTSQTQTTTTDTSTTQTTTTPAAGSSGGTSGSSGSSGAASTPTTPAQTTTSHPAPPAPTHHATPKPPPTGTLVRGQLVSDVVPLPADQSPLVHPLPAAAGGAPAREAPDSPSPLPIVAAALAVVGLLGLGAQRELGRPRWWPAALRIGH